MDFSTSCFRCVRAGRAAREWRCQRCDCEVSRRRLICDACRAIIRQPATDRAGSIEPGPSPIQNGKSSSSFSKQSSKFSQRAFLVGSAKSSKETQTSLSGARAKYKHPMHSSSGRSSCTPYGSRIWPHTHVTFAVLGSISFACFLRIASHCVLHSYVCSSDCILIN
jgi:hypothetical protein